MNFTEEYVLDFKSRFTYNSNNIEGNTLSLRDTISIISDSHIMASNKGQSLREVYEVVNHATAIDFILEKHRFNEEFILNVHNIVLDRLNYDRGEYKKHNNMIVGASFNTATVEQTPLLIKQLVDNTNYRIEQNKEDIFYVLADMHIKFEQIHPFSDGNGRTGRLLINKLLIDNDKPPIVIMGNEDKQKYYNMLDKSDVDNLATMFKGLSEVEEERIIGFENMHSTEIEEELEI